MTRRVLIFIIAVVLLGPAAKAAGRKPSDAEMARMILELQASHVAANVPPASTFSKLLERDVRAYLRSKDFAAVSLSIEPLRREATQNGIAYPKFFLWVYATDAKEHRAEGAMRVAAVDRVRFDVTDFVPAAAIRDDPGVLGAIFPALLIPAIRQHAGRGS